MFSCRHIKEHQCFATILQGSILNFLKIKTAVENLLKIVQSKAEAPNSPSGCYYSKLSCFIVIAKK